MKTTLKTILATAAMALCLGSIRMAHALETAGDIWEIRPCDADGASTNYGASASAPLDSSSAPLYFNIRLWNHANSNNTGFVQWDKKYVGSGSPTASNPEVVIYVSGEPTAVEIVKILNSGRTGTKLEAFTDLICKYTIQPGDFALPILLADAEGPRGYSVRSGELALANTNNWEIREHLGWTRNTDGTYTEDWGDKAAFALGDPRSYYGLTDIWGAHRNDYIPPEADSMNDDSLASCSFYVRTVNFDGNWETEGTLWRSVHEGSTETVGATPSLKVTATTTEARTLYVWSDDEEAVKVVGTPTDVKGDGTTVQMATVTIPGGTTPTDSVTFAIEGVNSNKTANLVLSAYPRYDLFYTTSSSGAVVTNFVTVPVSCVAALPPHLETVFEDGTARGAESLSVVAPQITGDEDEWAYQGEIRVKISGGTYSNALAVTVTPENSEAWTNGEEWSDYVRLSTTATTSLPGKTLPTVTIPADAEDAAQTIYVYALRSDTTTRGGNSIKFVASVTDADALAYLTGTQKDAALTVTASRDIITAPTEEGTAADPLPFVSGSPTPIAIGVADTYADTQDTNTCYTLYVKYTTYDTSFTTISNLVWASGALQDKDTGEQPKLTYPVRSGDYTTTTEIYLRSPVNGQTSTHVKFSATVQAPSSMTLATADGGSSYAEGETVTFTLTLSPDAYDSDLYVFLEAAASTLAGDTVTTNAVFSQSAFVYLAGDADDIVTNTTSSVKIPAGTASVTFELPVEDGAANGYAVAFTPRLRTAAKYGDGDAVGVYALSSDGPKQVKFTNTKAVFRSQTAGIRVGGTAVANGGSYTATIPSGSEVSFRASVTEPSAIDLEGTNFTTRWTVLRNGSPQIIPATGLSYQDILGDPATTNFTYVFTEIDDTATWAVQALVFDKDTDPDDITETSDPAVYTVNMASILSQPRVVLGGIADGASYGEDLAKRDMPTLTVSLNYTDPLFLTNTLYVAVKVSSDADAANPGRFALNPDYAWTNDVFEIAADGTQVPVTVEDSPTNAVHYYLLPMRATSPSASLKVTELDGVDDSFTISAYVAYTVSDGGATNAPLPSAGRPATTYYRGTADTGGNVGVFVGNVDPVFVVNPDPGLDPTNRIALVNGRYKITWSVTKNTDVAGDLDGGLTIAFVGSGNELTTNVNAAASGEYYPDFGEQTGDVDLYLTVTDKDGGTFTRHWPFTIRATRSLTVAANGPAKANATIELSSKYANMPGRGQGHVYVSPTSGAFVRSDYFWSVWNCGNNTEASVLAFGYRNGDRDDGNLNGGLDIATGIDASGNATAGTDVAAANAYTYSDPRSRDSFFYGWIQAGEPGGTDYAISVSPEVGTNGVNRGTIYLPKESLGDGEGYAGTYAEAVFSREHRRYDNMGDIDDDGIPDYFALKVYASGNSLATTDGAGGELGARNALNDDADFLPATSQLGDTTVVPGSATTWEEDSHGQPFSAALEIRGLGEGLNFGMFKFDSAELETGWVSDLELTANEKRALLRHIFERRDKLLEKIHAGKPLAVSASNNEPREFAIITNLLCNTYVAGTTSDDSGDTRFLHPGLTEADYTQIVTTNEATLAVTTNLVWLRTYTDADGEETVVTNAVRTLEIENDDGTTTTVLVNPCDDLYIGDVDLGRWLDGEDNNLAGVQQQWAKAYIDYTWRHFTTSDVWGWTCENRTDPTIADTDGDGMPDGYEYFLWYDAVVGADGTNRLTGCRFHLDDIESRDDVITPEDIADIFNPNVKRDWTRQDTDGDGLYDYEEFLIGTSPVDWDTDGDGLSDLYEVIYGLNPLSAQGGDNGGMNEDGDFMAVAELGTYTVVEDASDGSLWAFEFPTVVPVGADEDDETALTNTVSGQAFPVARFNGGYIPTTEDTATLRTEDKILTVTNGAPAGATVMLYHHQVYNHFGFDPRTAWAVCDNKTVSQTERWLDEGSPLTGGTPQNTSLYTAKDEFLLLKYRYIVGLRSLEDDKANIPGRTTMANVLLAGTTNPNTTREGTVLGDGDKTYGAITQHGADTDGDGVPDGWELYVGVSPNNDYRIARGNPGYDTLYWDGNGVWPSIPDTDSYADGLGLGEEYAGTDPSAGTYEACASIYANHPSQEGSAIKGWFNKLMPTDPRNADTDGDGISDGAERGDWSEVLTFNRWGQTKTLNEESVQVKVNHMSIYGNPTDTGSRCVKGGGFNPCTIDTDEDGLPDPWERQYAGVVFKDGVPVEGALTDFDSSVYDDIRAALSAYGATTSTNEEDSAGFYFTCMGMDGTVADAYTDPTTDRDLDWDGDGLQNWQEYLVQAMRHFRYDDDKTPLMGYDIPAFNETTGEYEPGAWNGANGFPQFDYATPIYPTASNLTALEQNGYPNFAAFIEENEDYLGTLGYFADPPREWDHVRIDGKYAKKYMLPPKRISRERTRATAVVDGEVVNLWRFKGGDDDVPAGATILSQIVGGSIYNYYRNPETGRYELVEPKYVYGTVTTSATGYVGTDPRLWDTDRDGMDDYWELFHGLNPILGSIGTPSTVTAEVGGVTVTSTTVVDAHDVIANAYGSVSTWRNGWIGWNNTETPPYDPVRFPWMMGAGACDADGDGLRNEEEALMANLTAPNAAHTDPSPLWMTDTTVTRQDLAVVETVQTNLTFTIGDEVITVYDPVTGEPVWIDETYTNKFLTAYAGPSYTVLFYSSPVSYWNGSGYAFSFEENEGYDTDNDWRSDNGELSSRVEATSDPQDFSDPSRRQSIWFGGASDPGAAISYEPVTRTANGDDFFRQFTVEAWVRPDTAATGADQYAVTRAANYGGWDLLNVESVIRLNFALGVDASGRAFAEMEGTTDTSLRLAASSALADGEWVHLAATYDGETFVLYVNGDRANYTGTTLIPANGVSGTLQDPQYQLNFPYTHTYSAVPSATVIGAKPNGAAAFDATLAASAASWADIATGFFGGSVSEVRTWDGARTANEIKGAYKTKFTADDIKTLRQAAYVAYSAGARRNADDSTTKTVLPAELIQNYSFGTLPGATEAANVATTPAGFEQNVLGVVQNPTSGAVLRDAVKVGWWSAILDNAAVSASAVYTSPHVVPWIENTVGHLPRLSGLMPDSVFWSENYAGYTPASFQSLSAFDLPNTMNPYNLAHRHLEDTYAAQKLKALSSTLRETLRYDTRFSLTGTSDLVPLGSAFARRSGSYWDGQGAESAWAATGADTDGDELPDWWEAYAAANYGVTGDISPDTEVTRNGLVMTAGEAYIRDLAAGLLPSRTKDAAFVNREDQDADGLPDWWQNLYGVKGGATGDDDHDGLSNYTEYLLSEVFAFGLDFSPVNAKSVSRYDTDYFFKIGQLYAGEIFTDHDMMEDAWENEQGSAYASSYAWDANLDPDEDGWRNFAECRYNQFTSGIIAKDVSHILGGTEIKDMPIPTLRLTLRYNGDQPITATAAGSSSSADTTDANSLASIVVQTFTKDGLVVPDATFTVTPGEVSTGYRYLGMWADRVVRGTLAPGHVDLNSFDIQFMSIAKNDFYVWRLYTDETESATYTMKSGTYEEYAYDLTLYRDRNTTYYRNGETLHGRVELLNGSSTWTSFANNPIRVTTDDSSENGYILYNGTRIGQLNLISGDYSLDLGAFANSAMSSVTNSAESVVAANSSVRLVYQSQVPRLGSNRLVLNLGEADLGYVKEGENTIVAFYDLDGDGKYTAGEPMGTVRADVGWRQGAAEIELTDTSPMITRADLLTGTSDRKALYGTEDGDYYNIAQQGELSGGKYQRIRVIRTLVNGWGVDDLDTPDAATGRVIIDKWIELDQRSYFFEGDVLESGAYDIDWNLFKDEVMGNGNMTGNGGSIDPTAVAYRVVLGNGSIASGDTNNLFSIVTVRHFDTTAARTRPVAVTPGSQEAAVYEARPVFKWTMKALDDVGQWEDNNSYTAFKVQVLEANGSTVVWDSGYRLAPARDLNGVYTFTPDVYAGDGRLEADRNYRWRVSMYNAKFKDEDLWSTNTVYFRMNALTNSTTYGSIKVCARYFGPDTVRSAGTVRIEAFTTPDFTGDPVARTYIDASDASVGATNTEHTANATLVGLPKGTYYVRGYVDMTRYGTAYAKDDWESWGYVCPRNGSSADMFMPSSIVVGDTVGESETVDLWIEDADTNGNNLPDAWEMVKNGGRLDYGTERIDDTLNSGIIINREITDNLQTLEGTSTISGLASYVFSVVKNAGVAVLALDADMTGHSSYTKAALSAAGVESTANATDVTITAIETTDDAVTLSATIGATVSKRSAATGRKTLLGAGDTMYDTTASTAEDRTVQGVVEYKLDLTDADWTPTATYVTVEVNADGSYQTGAFTVPKPTGAQKQCFYRIRILD